MGWNFNQFIDMKGAGFIQYNINKAGDDNAKQYEPDGGFGNSRF
jgi:hypothetical protein